jgi:Ser/Thr protein kinase RdoA (MazF antagonist)
VTPALYARICDAYGIAAAPPPRPVGGRVERLGDFAIKIFAAAEADRARLEAALLTHLADGPGYRVPSLVTTATGECVLDADDAHVVVTRWEAGAFKPYTEIAPDEWEALGRTLAALHARLDGADAIALPARLSGLMRARDLGRERAILARHRAEVLARAPAEALRRYFDARQLLLDERATRACAGLPDDPERPIHNDYNQYNYVFRPDAPPLILDWERAIGAPREYEVVRCLNHLPLVAPVAARRFVDGYRALRALDAARLAWAVDAALADHAVKHWPVDAWLAAGAGAAARLDANVEVTTALADGRAELARFFGAG